MSHYSHKIYTFGGYSVPNNTRLPYVFKYDRLRDEWTEKPGNPNLGWASNCGRIYYKYDANFTNKRLTNTNRYLRTYIRATSKGTVMWSCASVLTFRSLTW